MKDTAKPDTADNGASRSTGNGLTKVTVNLTRRAVDALDKLSDATEYSKTDIINRALQVYQIIYGYQDEAGGLVIKPGDGSAEVRLHIV